MPLDAAMAAEMVPDQEEVREIPVLNVSSNIYGMFDLRFEQGSAPDASATRYRADRTVEVVAGGNTGIREFLFTFRRPLDHQSYHFFMASPRFSAYPLKF